MNDKLFIIDWAKVQPETIKLLESGKARIINGVARNVGKKYQIIQHMPFTQVELPNNSNLLDIAKVIQSTQATVNSMIALSSVATMGAVVISTAYLSHKLDNIQRAIDMLQKEMHGQNLVYYAERITTYFGTVEATRELINNNDIILENPDLVILKISELSNIRNQLISFLDNLITLSDNFTIEHKTIAIDFINMTFDLLPKGIFVESQAAYKAERFYLGDSIRECGRIKYDHSIQSYRNWVNGKYHSVLKGEVDSNTKVFQGKFETIKSLVSSEENKILLENPA